MANTACDSVTTDWHGTAGAADEPDTEAFRLEEVNKKCVNLLLGGLTVNCVDDNNAATTGTALFVVVDKAGGCYLASACAGTATTVALTDTGGDIFRVHYDADPAGNLGGKQIYFDEDGTAQGRFQHVSSFNKDAHVSTLDGRILVIADSDDAATDGVAVYFDDDAADATEKIMFVSPTNTTGTDTCSTTIAALFKVTGE